MENIVWRKNILSDLFNRNTPPNTNAVAKELEIFDNPFDGGIALITRAEKNNGVKGYIEKKDYPTLKKGITYNDQFSLFLFHNYEFTTIKDHLSIIEAKNDVLRRLMNDNDFVNSFFTLILNHVFSKKIFNFNFTGADYRFDREIILLPCIEVSKEEEYIWEEKGHYYTLAVEYINKLMEQAKELREKKTIRLYEAERAKYEAERAKYEAGYKRERDVLVWKKFTLGELYSFDTSGQYPFTQKDMDMSEVKDDYYNLAVIAQSAKNNGVIGFINDEKVDSKYKHRNLMTFSLNFGICFYHNYDFLLLDTHGSIFKLVGNNTVYNNILKGEDLCNIFISKLIDKICARSVYNYNWKPNSSRVAREIILLPCIEVSKEDEYIREEKGHYYTLAVEYISYMYLSGRVEYNQKLIDNYTYQY